MLTAVIESILKRLSIESRYLIRLDDACETHDREKWGAIERILDQFSLKPIVAVIPKNEDPSLYRSALNKDFWGDVKRWQSKGWSIAIHGYNHLYHHVNKETLVFPFYNRSEFAGLELEAQSALLRKANSEFIEHDIRPELWVAPGHCFDSVTLEAIRLATDIRVISDGIAIFPYSDNGFTFVPQQLWWPKKKLLGIWTICLHPNTMTDAQINALELVLEKHDFWKKVITLNESMRDVRKKGVCSSMYARLFWFRWKLRRR